MMTQNQELLNMVETERKKQNQRKQNLKNCSDQLDRQVMENKYDVQRAEAQRNITEAMERHKDELDRVSNGGPMPSWYYRENPNSSPSYNNNNYSRPEESYTEKPVDTYNTQPNYNNPRDNYNDYNKPANSYNDYKKPEESYNDYKKPEENYNYSKPAYNEEKPTYNDDKPAAESKPVEVASQPQRDPSPPKQAAAQPVADEEF